jgi:predicted esterase
MMRLARRIADGNMVVISLQGPNQLFINYGRENVPAPMSHRVGFGWGTTYKMEESVALHHRNLRALIDLAVRKHAVDKSRIFLLGFSQACSYNYRFVFSHPDVVRGCIGVCGGAPGDWHENPKYYKTRTDVLHIAASQDIWFSREKNLEIRGRLAERARSLDFRFYKSPHRFPRAAIPHIRRWIEKHV